MLNRTNLEFGFVTMSLPDIMVTHEKHTLLFVQRFKSVRECTNCATRKGEGWGVWVSKYNTRTNCSILGEHTYKNNLKTTTMIFR